MQFTKYAACYTTSPLPLTFIEDVASIVACQVCGNNSKSQYWNYNHAFEVTVLDGLEMFWSVNEWDLHSTLSSETRGVACVARYWMQHSIIKVLHTRNCQWARQHAHKMLLTHSAGFGCPCTCPALQPYQQASLQGSCESSKRIQVFKYWFDWEFIVRRICRFSSPSPGQILWLVPEGSHHICLEGDTNRSALHF